MDRVSSGPSFSIQTFGCKVNSYDTGLLQQRLQRQGWTWSEAPKVQILNTCAVTGEATKEALRQIRRIKAKQPEALVVVTGCAAQVDTDQFSALKAADLIIANSHKGSLETIVADYYKGKLTERVFKSNIFKKEDLEAGGGEELFHTRSFLKIQDGCDSFCTYCVIPFARGKSRSLKIEHIVERVQQLYQKNVREVVLTGVHIGDYEDQGRRLEDLVEAILSKTAMPRLRLSSLEPVELSPRLLDLYTSSQMCPHFHMSIQSAQSRVLQAMKRNYQSEDVEKSLIEIEKRVAGAFVGMDVIVGFPGETEQEFLETYNRLQSLPWTRLHVFPYSERPGTYAARLHDQKVASQEIQRRSKMLRQLSHDRFLEVARRQVGKSKEVLILSSSPRNQEGEVVKALSRDYFNVEISPLAREAYTRTGEVQVVVQGVRESVSGQDPLLQGKVVERVSA